MRIFRLHRRQRPAADFSGSLLFAGRWNPAGTPLLYASTALSLACLELLVHLAPDKIPSDYVYTSADIGDAPEIPDFRGNLKTEDATRRYGHAWATSRRALAIYVPSVIIPSEFNVLLNPLHPEFGRVVGIIRVRSTFIEEIECGLVGACYTQIGMTLDELEREYGALRQQADAVRSYL